MKKEFTFQKKGFTLSEAIIAAAVLIIGVVAIMEVFPSSIKTSSSSRRTTIAVNLAQSTIEQTISQEFNLISFIPKERISSDPNDPFYDYFKQVNVTFVDQNLAETENDTGLKKISAIISWIESGQEKNVIVPTLISRK
jgi:Tfp pilus assembly protein PilV